MAKSSRRKVNKTKTKKNPYFGNYDLYSDANPKDTIRIRYKTKRDVIDTISRLEKMYRNGRITHSRNIQIVNVMTQRLRVIKNRNHKIDNGRYSISKNHFNKLKLRSKQLKSKTRRKSTRRKSTRRKSKTRRKKD